MKRLTLLMALAGTVALLAGAGGDTYRGGSYAPRLATYRGGPAGAAAAPETTMWVFKTMWDTTSVVGTHASPYYEGEGDTLIQDPNGSLFKYGFVYEAARTTVQYNSGNARITSTHRDGSFPSAGARANFFVWPLDTIPQGTEVISAKVTFQTTLPSPPPTLPAERRIVAVIDTSTADYVNYIAGATQSSNPSHHSPCWDFASGTTPWSFDLDNGSASDVLFSDLGIAQTVIGPLTAPSSNWWEADITGIVQKYIDLGLQNKLIWFFAEGGSGVSYYWDIGPNTTALRIEPVLTVKTSTKPRRQAVRFAVFSDAHSNSKAPQIMKATMDAAGFVPDFLVHNGDLNLDEDCDSTLVAAGIDTAWAFSPPPVMWSVGNHEVATACANPNAILTIHDVAANRAFLEGIKAEGGVLRSLGDLTTQERRFRTFSFDIGPAHIATVDVHTTALTPKKFAVADSVWLVRDLQASSQPVKIVFSHHPLYWGDEFKDIDFPAAAAPDSNDYGAIRNIERFVAALQVGGADAYIHGHTHVSHFEVVDGFLNIAIPSTKADKEQGFSTFEVSETGRVTVKFYRGVQGDEAWELKHTTTF